jgi:signal transduction histidine kinase
VASNSGLLRYFKGAWIENGQEDGLPAAGVRDVCEDQRGRLWAGTIRGLSLFHPGADTDPPHTTVHSLAGENVPEGGTITLTFSGRDKWKYTPSDRLLCSFRLDERDWTSFQDVNGVSFNDLPPGKHYFQVRAMDHNGNIDSKPARFDFLFVLPWYKESRLLVITCLGVAAAAFFAALAVNRHRQLVRSYAEVEQKVTERTQELELASRELMHSQKMNALGTLAAGIAHDFNNILSIIQGSAQIIEENLENPEKVRTRLDRIKMVVEQGSGIVKAMLGFSRDSTTQPPGPCDVNAVVQDTIKLLGDRFLRTADVSFQPAPNLPPVAGSKDFIQQILLNFIFNAAESMAKRKQILLATAALERVPANLVLTPAPAGRYVSISVQDFGCGISPENRSRIFEPFFTTKALSTRRGTGLGLSMVFELARKMDAGLAVESVVDQGSTFTLFLPVDEVAATQEKL